jgi:hypothetical protein
MKKNLFALFLFLAAAGSVVAQCDAKEIAKKCKSNLKPFKYDGYNDTHFTFKDKPQTVEVEFTAYAEQTYKLIFCSSGFKEEVKVNIYDKTKSNPKRKQVFDSSSGIDNLFWSFEPPKTGTYYIEYEIPAALDHPNDKTGCMVLMVGYK